MKELRDDAEAQLAPRREETCRLRCERTNGMILNLKAMCKKVIIRAIGPRRFRRKTLLDDLELPVHLLHDVLLRGGEQK